MAVLSKLFPFKSLSAIVGIFLAWQALVFISPEPRDYSELELAAVHEICADVSTELRSDARRRAGLVHFLNDPDDSITALFKQRLAETPGLQIDDSSVVQRFLQDIARSIKDASSLDEVINAGRRVELDLIVGGRVIEIVEKNDLGEALIEVYAYDLNEGGWIMKREFAAQARPSAAQKFSKAASRIHPLWRLLIWLLVVGLLPWLTAPLIHKTVESKSNIASAALLGFYILVGTLLALLLSGFRVDGVWDGITLILAVAACAVYSYLVSERIAEG
jgi:hypothetical protein